MTWGLRLARRAAESALNAHLARCTGCQGAMLAVKVARTHLPASWAPAEEVKSYLEREMCTDGLEVLATYVQAHIAERRASQKGN